MQESILFEQLFLFDQIFEFYLDLVFKIRYFNIQLSVIWYLIQILSAFTSWLNWDLNTTKNVVKILMKFISTLGFTRLMGLILKLVYYKTQTTMGKMSIDVRQLKIIFDLKVELKQSVFTQHRSLAPVY